MKKITPNATVYVFLGCLGFALAGIALFVGIKFIISQGAAELATRVRDNAFIQAQEVVRLDIERLYENSAEERALLATHILTEANIIDFISDVEHIAASEGLSFTTESITLEEIKDVDFNDMVVVVSFAGPERNVMSMITTLEELPYHGRVDSVTITVADDTSWEAQVMLRVTMTKS